jgi:hypothetical protein
MRRTTIALGIAAALAGCSDGTGAPGDGGTPDLASADLAGRDAAGADAARAPDAAGSDAAGADLSLAAANFQARCSAPGVVRCVGFDAPGDIAGTYGDVSGILPGATAPTLDPAVMASGASSIKFTIPPNTGADTSGSYFTNFSDDLMTRFGESSEFYVQWRQRFDAGFLTTAFQGGEGWKQIIVGSGDLPGCTANNSANGQCYSSCSALELVALNTYQRGFPEMYNSCTGSTSHGAYDPFEQPFGGFDFKLENAMPAPYCLYSQGQTNPPSYFQPQGNCFGYAAGEWMTFQIHVAAGPRVADEFAGSRVQLWVAREGQPSTLVIDWGPYNLSAGSATEDQRYGKVWLLPYNTNKDPAQVYPTTYTWYDELIVSTQRIADPT